MKSSFIVGSLCATLAMAGPLDKRALQTQWDIETVTVTVTGTAGATPVAEAQGGQFYGNGGRWGQWSQSAAESSAAVVVVPTQASSKAAAPSAPASDSNLSGYAKPILDQHNIHRANHSAPAMQWDDNLASIAQQIAQTCVYEHSTDVGGGGYGQNIGAGSKPEDVSAMITNDMYNGEVAFYPGYGGEPSMDNFEKWGHFSQIVWADTTSLGCYTADCTGSGLANTGGNIGAYFTVCNYKPAGNFGGRYGKNVLAPSNEATVTV